MSSQRPNCNSLNKTNCLFFCDVEVLAEGGFGGGIQVSEFQRSFSSLNHASIVISTVELESRCVHVCILDSR